MLRRNLPSPDAPSVMGEHEGRPYWLWLPKAEGQWPGMVILHGSGSRKENHGDFARMCAAGGWAAISYDQRGHGDSADEMSPAALGDVAKMARFLASHDRVDASKICVRGSSMGGFWAIHSAATSKAIAGAIAICPAGEEHLRRMLGGQAAPLPRVGGLARRPGRMAGRARPARGRRTHGPEAADHPPRRRR